MKSWIEIYNFTFKGTEGIVEVNNDVAFIRYGTMGFSLDSITGPLHDFVVDVMKREPDRRYMK